VLLGRKSRGSKKMKKIVMLLLLLLVVVVPTVSADVITDITDAGETTSEEVTDFIEINAVYVNGVEVTGANLVQVELAKTAQVQVHFTGASNSDIRVKTWIGGYEFSTIEDTTEVFEIVEGVSYTKFLYVNIPEDLDVTSNEYTLHVEWYDSTSKEEVDYILFFEQERHRVVVEDVILTKTTVAPGESFGVKVRLDNQGKTFEEDLRVTVSMSEFGISQRIYMDELEVGDQDETSTLFLTLPTDTRTGNFPVTIDVSYASDSQESQEVVYVRVEGSLLRDEEAIVSMSPITDLVVGEAQTFKLQITNFAETGKTFTVAVEGMPASVHNPVYVAGGASTEVYFTIEASEPGVESVLVKVTSDTGLVDEQQYSVKVTQRADLLVPLLSAILAVLIVMALALAYRRFF
jgi:hypothetical protein